MLTALTDDALALSRRGEVVRLLPADKCMRGCAAALLSAAQSAVAGSHVAQAELARVLSEVKDPSGASEKVKAGLSQTLLALCAVALPPPALDRSALRLEVFMRAAEVPFAHLLRGEREEILRRVGETHGVTAACIEAWLFSDVQGERLLRLPACCEPALLIASWHRLTLATMLAGSLRFRIETEGAEGSSSHAVDAVAQAFAAQGVPRVVERLDRVWSFRGLGSAGVKVRKRRLAQALIRACADLPLECLGVSVDARWKDGKLVTLESPPAPQEASQWPSTLLQVTLASAGDASQRQASGSRAPGRRKVIADVAPERATVTHCLPGHVHTMGGAGPQVFLGLGEPSAPGGRGQLGWALTENAAWPLDEVIEQGGIRTLIQHVDLWYPQMFAPWSELRLPEDTRLAVRLDSAASLLAPKGSPRALLGHINII